MCQFHRNELKGNTSIYMTFDQNILTFTTFHVWWNYAFINQTLLDSWEDKAMTGFSLEWHLEDKNGDLIDRETANHKWKPYRLGSSKNNANLIKMVNLVHQARMNKQSLVTLYNHVVEYKIHEVLYIEQKCVDWQSEGVNTLMNNFFELNPSIGVGKPSVSDEDLIEGLKLYATFLYCPDSSHDVKLDHFYQYILTNHTPRTVIQATINNMKIDHLYDDLTKQKVTNFFHKLDSKLNFAFGKLAIAMSSNVGLQEDHPFMTKYAEVLQKCLRGLNCQKLTGNLQELGKTDSFFVNLHFSFPFFR